MQTLPTEFKTFTVEALPYHVKVEFTPEAFKAIPVHHFAFYTDPRFIEFTETGYFSFFCYTEQLLCFNTIEEAASAVIMMRIRENDPKAAVRIERKQWIPTLF